MQDPARTMWHHDHVNVNEHVATRGMWGPFIIDPIKPAKIEREITRAYILLFSEWASAWADKLGQGGVPGDAFDSFTLNGKTLPETQPFRAKEGDVIRLRMRSVELRVGKDRVRTCRARWLMATSHHIIIYHTILST